MLLVGLAQRVYFMFMSMLVNEHVNRKIYKQVNIITTPFYQGLNVVDIVYLNRSRLVLHIGLCSLSNGIEAILIQHSAASWI